MGVKRSVTFWDGGAAIPNGSNSREEVLVGGNYCFVTSGARFDLQYKTEAVNGTITWTQVARNNGAECDFVQIPAGTYRVNRSQGSDAQVVQLKSIGF